MPTTILRAGLIAGLTVAVPLFALTLFAHVGGAAGMAIGYLVMLVGLATIFVAVRGERESRGGAIGFWPAFGMGVAISAVAGIVYVAGWEAALAASGQDFGADYARAMVRAAEARGAAGEALARARAEAEAFRASYADPLVRLPMTFAEIFPVGVLVSLVSAALLRNPRFLPAPARRS